MTLKKILMASLDSFYNYYPQPKPDINTLAKAQLIAHRGNHLQFTENTIEAFQSCLDSGVFGIEFDVRWTKDHEPIVLHDPTLSRVFKRNDFCPSKVTVKELKSKEPRIPTLKEVLELFSKKIHLMIELKTPVDNYAELSTKQQRLENLLQTLTPGADFHIMSLDPKNFDLVPSIQKSALLSIAETNTKSVLKWTHELSLGGYTGHYALINESLLKKLKDLNFKTGTGFINSKNLLFRELHREVDYLFSNNPLLVQKIIQEAKQSL